MHLRHRKKLSDMRIIIHTTSNTQTVPFDHQVKIVGALHKWLGHNELHDDLSLYSLSWLSGGEGNGKGLDFPKGARFFISSPLTEVLLPLALHIPQNPEIAYGLKATDVRIVPDPGFGERERFLLQSPVLIKRSDDESADPRSQKFYFPDDLESDRYMTETLQHKLKRAGLSRKVKVKFDRTYRNPRVKLTTYKGIQNKATFCPVIIEGEPEALRFAWNVGIGNSTGIGFGALR